MVIDEKEKHTYFIDIAIVNYRNVVEKEEGKERKKYTTGHGSQRTMATGKGHNYPVSLISHRHHIKKLYRKTFRNWAYQNTSTPKSRKQSYLKHAQLSGNS